MLLETRPKDSAMPVRWAFLRAQCSKCGTAVQSGIWWEDLEEKVQGSLCGPTSVLLMKPEALHTCLPSIAGQMQ